MNNKLVIIAVTALIVLMLDSKLRTLPGISALPTF
jgi:hypothetical protein